MWSSAIFNCCCFTVKLEVSLFFLISVKWAITLREEDVPNMKSAEYSNTRKKKEKQLKL